MLDLLTAVLLAGLAVLASIVGSIIGAGGGFIYTPLLILMGYPPRLAVSTSLVMVLFNSLSASYAYYRQGRIDLKKTIPLGLVTLPGSIAGSYLLSSLNINDFKLIFGLFLVVVSLYLIVKNLGEKGSQPDVYDAKVLSGENIRRAYFFSPLAGLLSGMFGIGGGVLLVPTFIHVALIPTHIATATSQLITVFSAYFAFTFLTLTKPMLTIALPLVAVSGIAGGQIGARISRRLRAKVIKTIVALALIIAAINMMIRT